MDRTVIDIDELKCKGIAIWTGFSDSKGAPICFGDTVIIAGKAHLIEAVPMFSWGFSGDSGSGQVESIFTSEMAYNCVINTK
jgi:hypothetical protein